MRYLCDECGRSYSRAANLNRHKAEVHNGEVGRRRHRCRRCGRDFPSRGRLVNHACRGQNRPQPRVLVRDRNYDDNTANAPHTDPPELNQIYNTNWPSIRSSRYNRRYQDILNCRLLRLAGDTEPSPPAEALVRVWNDLDCTVKVNVSYGVLLRHSTSGRLRYYHASSNNATVFPVARTISNRADLNQLIDTFEGLDPAQLGINRRDGSAWILQAVTNVTFYVYKLLGVNRVGCTRAIELPAHILKSRSILAMTKKRQTGKMWGDNLCFFRCLAVEHEWDEANSALVSVNRRNSPPQQATHRLYSLWQEKREELEDIGPKEFPGVALGDLWELEELFDLSISVFSLNPDGASKVVWTSGSKRTWNVHLNLEQDHFSLIIDIATYAKSFTCKTCNRVFTRKHGATSHTCLAKDAAQFKFAGEPFVQTKTIFDKLEDIGVCVDEAKRYYPYRITYDIETYMDNEGVPEDTPQCSYEAVHRLMSISACSNVPGFTEPKCFVSCGDSKDVVGRFVDHLLLIARSAKRNMHQRYRLVREKVRDMCDRAEKVEVLERVKELVGSPKGLWDSRKRMCKIEDEFNRYLSVIPVVSFNGQKYDVNVMKADLLSILIEEDPASEDERDAIRFTIKRNSSMACFESAHLRFVDITNFIAPGSNYAGYLKAFGVEEPKGFFPYQWVDSLEKLKFEALPPQEAFYSTLRQECISDEDYQFCQRVWVEKEMRTMRDFLVWYNNCDVKPFLEAIAAQVDIYRSKKIDMLKASVSLPGAAQCWLMVTSDKSRHIPGRSVWVDFLQDSACGLRAYLEGSIPVKNIHESYKVLYEYCRKNMVGGPSIVFHRYHEVGETKIREDVYGSEAKSCGLVQGYDANALYAYCVAQPQPVDHPVCCEYKDGVLDGSMTGGTSGWSVGAHSWLEYVKCSGGLDIQHVHNGKEMRIGRHGVKVDGYCASTHTVYEFLGCYWHGHSCLPNSGSDLQQERLAKTKLRLQYTLELGYNLEVMWECEWKRKVRVDADIGRFVRVFEEVWYPKWAPLSTELQVLDAVRDGSFFGLVRCDVQVPPELEDRFSEMSPLFGHAKLGEEHMSAHMRSFVVSSGMSVSAHKSLVGANRAEGMLLHSELLRWYLEKGLIASNVTRTFRYKKKAIFEQFVVQATESRRQGDSDPSLALHANMAKLSVNSVYGKTITNKENHKNVKYSQDPESVSALIASDRFVSLEELGDGLCEVVNHKRSLAMNVPVVVGFSILQLAKLRMLQFYYDCIDRFVDRKDFQYVEMDTDSAYMALSAPLESVLKPGTERAFWEQYSLWFPRRACEAHGSSFIECMLAGEPWVQDECCRRITKHDSRTPGLFKEEYRGTGAVALNSKTYVCWDSTKNTSKASSKGISKRLNELTANVYKDVLQTQQPFTGVNRGFIRKDRQMVTYKQSRAGITYYYVKRRVLEDGVSTAPLDITLKF